MLLDLDRTFLHDLNVRRVGDVIFILKQAKKIMNIGETSVSNPSSETREMNEKLSKSLRKIAKNVEKTNIKLEKMEDNFNQMNGDFTIYKKVLANVYLGEASCAMKIAINALTDTQRNQLFCCAGLSSSQYS